MAIVSMGAISSEAKEAVDRLRKEKLPVGAIKLRVFRPFPVEAFQELGKRVKAFVVIDRDISFGMEGFLASETKASLFNLDVKPLVAGFIAGLGGRDVTADTIEMVVKKSLKCMHMRKIERDTEWVELRE